MGYIYWSMSNPSWTEGQQVSLQLTPTAANTLPLSWTAPTEHTAGIAEFEIQRYNYNNNACSETVAETYTVTVADPASMPTSYTAMSLAPSTTYCFRIRAKGQRGL